MTGDADYRAAIDVQSFQSTLGEAAVLEAVWTVCWTKDGKAETGRTSARETVQTKDYDALAAAHSRALARLSQDIANAVRALDSSALIAAMIERCLALALRHYGSLGCSSKVLSLPRSARRTRRTDNRSAQAQLDPAGSGQDELRGAILKLAPKNDLQHALKAQAVRVVGELGQLRWLLFEQSGRSISMPLLVVVIMWLAIIFASWGLFAPITPLLSLRCCSPPCPCQARSSWSSTSISLSTG